MNILTYDGSWAGFLTAVFEVYEYKIQQPFICKETEVCASLFGSIKQVQTDPVKAERVIKKLKEKLSPKVLSEVYKSFLSELKSMENNLFGFIRNVLSTRNSVEQDYTNRYVLFVHQTSKKVHREKHRMEAFVRFQLTKDQLYYSVIQPDFNVLPLILSHFKNRYADQRWLIYDARRKYGLYYDTHAVTEVTINFSKSISDTASTHSLYDEKETLYQVLWQQYFSSVNIASRKNTKLHIQHMPKRYWKYLVEKQANL